MFFESACEKREQAIKIIGYLLMRGNHTQEVGQLIQNAVCIHNSVLFVTCMNI